MFNMVCWGVAAAIFAWGILSKPKAPAPVVVEEEKLPVICEFLSRYPRATKVQPWVMQAQVWHKPFSFN